MRSRTIVAALLTMAGIGVAVSNMTAAPVVKWAAVNLKETVLIAGSFVSGPVVFVHDDARMARGEPCTSVRRYEDGKGVGEEIVAFHCRPRWGQAPSKFTQATTRRPDGPAVMTEYQFAGDEEAHLIPIK